jgi:outer membrane protein TolC
LNTNVIEPVTRFQGASINPRAQTVTTAGLTVPLFVPVRWAERNQAADQVLVSDRAADEARRQIAVAAGQAYLTVIAQRRVLELNGRARDNAREHYDYANQRFEGGVGSRLNAVRAQEELLRDEGLVQDALLAVRRAQEALGVLIAADGPIDAAAEPAFQEPPEGASDAALVEGRRDLQLAAGRVAAAERRAADSWRDRLPSLTALFTPQVLAPTGLFANGRSWQGTILFVMPVFDSGERRGQARERQALVDSARADRTNIQREAQSDLRIAREAIASTRRSLDFSRRAAEQADEVVRITDLVFREGATTNIEVLDAQRRALDAQTAAAIAEDALRRAQLELLIATGRFP